MVSNRHAILLGRCFAAMGRDAPMADKRPRKALTGQDRALDITNSLP
jgi:hypothetical protein